ncbi:hypothetical protein PMW_192 [Pseudomonas phage phiPMW]|uniref:Uncharacterized protein n=1 Tax=Pseudomonas phage phiPMW TaxID=1815582 RepID=A0A1S5R1N3_9CAUD|nr:hypothetical protein FDG97_gp158 [Pseudomonas phage phiPMW]ANA49317.1 hypothetical protein PMW_192 [Pseudomonas phage phiPMW]
MSIEIAIYITVGIIISWGLLYWYSRSNYVDMEDMIMFTIILPFLWPFALLITVLFKLLVGVRDWLNNH